jgi:hypothetical protein
MPENRPIQGGHVGSPSKAAEPENFPVKKRAYRSEVRTSLSRKER